MAKEKKVEPPVEITDQPDVHTFVPAESGSTIPASFQLDKDEHTTTS